MKRKNRDDSFLDLIVSKHARHSLWLKSLTVAASMVVVAAVVLMAQPASALTDAAELGVVAEQSAEESEQKDTTEEVQEADADTGSEDTDAGSVDAEEADEDDGSTDVSVDGTDSVEEASEGSDTDSGDDDSETADISESDDAAEADGAETGESMSSEDPEDIDASDHSTDKEEIAEADEADAAVDDEKIVEADDVEIADDEIEVISEDGLPLELDELEIATSGDFPLELELPLEIEYAAGTLVYDGDDFYVEMNYTEDAKIPEGSILEVTRLAEDSDEFADAKSAVVDSKKEEDEDFDEASLGFAAIDISIKDPEGEIIEPETGVSVRIEMKQLPEEVDHKVLSETLEVQHLNESTGETVVETVAEASDVTVVDTSAIAEFDIESFSIFTLTWTEPVPGSATIHFGTMPEQGEFEEFDEETISFDTNAASFSIANTFDGYVYTGAIYCTGEQTVAEGVNMDSILYKAESGWELIQYTNNEDDEIEETRVPVADGSNIYAIYYVPGEDYPSGADDDTIPSPTTEKSVTRNENGTYTIQLDVTGATVTEDNSHYANILVVLDATRSMNGTKWTNAKAAMRTLVETLCEGDNAANAGKIDFALVTFGRSATVTQNWTKDNAAFKSTCAGLNMVTTSGTNWEAGMRGGLYGVLNNLPDDDPTFVIFLTDGDPNVYYSSGSDTNYTNSGTTNGYSQNANTSASHAADEAKAIAATTKLYGIYCGDSGTTPSGDSYNRLVSIITGQGQGGQKTIAANADTIENEFKKIAETALESMGANNASVDDGIPSLSSVSAQTAGEAGAFEYYIKSEADSEFKTWADAPGASYSNDNGVTWDLSEVGTLPEKTTYRLRFTVWPSQEALDLIANLNNGTVEYDSLPADVKDQIKVGKEGGYTLATNTHLNTTYTFKGNTYSDSPEELVSEDMPLVSEIMHVKKAFAHDINEQDPYTQIEFYLLVDGKYYQSDGTTSEALDESKVYKLPVNAGNDWTNQVYIAPGYMAGDKVLETGHKYSLDETILVGNEYEYEFTPQTVRPMIINGTLTFLVLEDKYNPVPTGAQTYTIDNETYFVASTNSGALVGTNRKTAELDITKMIVDNTGNMTDDQLDAETFTYRVTLTVPADADVSGITAYEYVARWDDDPEQGRRYTIFGYQSDEDASVRAIDSDVSRFSGKIYGGYTVTTSTTSRQMADMFVVDGDKKTATIDITLKRKEIIRFTNLPADTEYTITEMYNNYRQADPSRDADAAGSDKTANIADQGYSTTVATKSRNPVSGDIRTGSEQGTTVSGTIDYLDVRYYNQFTNTLNDTIDVELKGTKHLDGYEWSGERYYFNLSGEDSAPMPIEGAYGRKRFYLTEASGSADKTYTFGKVRFTEAGTYTYTIDEDNAGTSQVINGKIVQFGTPETVTIVIAENNGKLSVESVTGENTTWDAKALVANTTITNTYSVTEASASKAWKNADGTTDAPEGASVVFTLYADGEEAGYTVTLDGTADEAPTGTAGYESEGWTATFVNLPKVKIVDGEAVEIEYTIAETEGYAGYTASTEEPVASGETITNTQESTSANAIKAWKNADGTTEEPEGAIVVFTLYADGKATKYTVTLDGTADAKPDGAAGYESEAWKAEFINLPKYQAGTTTAITYTVAETTSYAGYTASTEEPVASGETITNTQEPTTAYATKAWKNADGTTEAPEGASVVFTLYADGTAKYTVTLDGTADAKPDGAAGYESEAWKASFVNLPKYQAGTTTAITYTVAETTSYAGYTASTEEPVAAGSEITNTQEPTSANATKEWKNADGTTTAPEGASVVFTLYADGEATEYTVTLDGKTETKPTGTAGYESEGWTAAFVNLPKYKVVDGEAVAIEYTVAETAGYAGYTASTEEAVASGETITNTQEPTEASAKKAWKNADGTTDAPEGASVVFTLYADGEATEYTVTLDGTTETAPTVTGGYESEAWTAKFVELPKYKAVDGEAVEIEYTVTETTTYPGYTASTTDPVASGETITNEQGSTETYAVKAWKNADGTTEAPEGASVVFTLYADGEATEYTVELDGTADDKPTGTAGYESEAWKAEFINLPQSKIVDGEAVAIVYTIAETTAYPGYKASTADAVGSGSTITNTQEPTEVNAKKAWKNADGTTEAPEGASVVFTLYADGEATEYTVTLDGTTETAPSVTGGYESKAWTATFVNLPKFKIVDGKAVEIEYTVAETEGYAGYTASTTEPVAAGGEITNTQESTSANAKKAWKNADGTTDAPEGATVVFTLYADGEETEYTVELDGTADDKPAGTAGYESEAWKAEFINLPKYKVENGDEVAVVYTVAETTTYPGYNVNTDKAVESGSTIINTQVSTDANAKKAWKNADGTTEAPDGATVVFTLYADGEATEYTAELDGTTETAPTVTGGYESEAWTAKFVNLPKYQAGTETEIEYTIAETEGYAGYTASTEEAVASGETITNTQDATTASAKKAWKNADGTTEAPEGASVVFTLYVDGSASDYIVTLDGTVDSAPEGTAGYESEAWTATFVNLPKYQAGTETEIKYTIAETEGYAGYTASTEEAVASGEAITNTQDATEASATKAWKNADGSTDAPEGASVVFTLYADGEATEYTVTLDGTTETAPTVTGGYESEAWTATFVNLPKYKVVDGEAVAIEYTIAETTGYEGYAASTTEAVESGSTITNTQIAAQIGLIKIGDGDAEKLLSGVRFGLFLDKEGKNPASDASGAEVKPVTTDANGKVTVGYLVPGTYYLVEQKTVEGFKLLDKPVEIVITAVEGSTDGSCDVRYTQPDYADAPEPTVTEDGLFELTINNATGSSLPSTGGVGTTIFYILGSILTAGAAILLSLRKRLGQ